MSNRSLKPHQRGILPIRFGVKRKMFSLLSLLSSRAADLALFFEEARFEGVDTEPLLGESSLSSAARVAFCRRVLALIVCERDDWRTVSRIGRVRCMDIGQSSCCQPRGCNADAARENTPCQRDKNKANSG